MLYDSTSAVDADFAVAEQPDHSANLPTKSTSNRLSDDEQRYVWALLLKNNFVGQVWPVYKWDDDEPLYELLIDRDLAVSELNAVSDLPITAQQLRTVVSRFAGKGTLKSRIEDFYAKRKDRRIRA